MHGISPSMLRNGGSTSLLPTVPGKEQPESLDEASTALRGNVTRRLS